MPQNEPQENPILSTASLDRFAARKLESLKKSVRHRSLSTSGRKPAGRVVTDDVERISFACNDYLGLSHHPDVIEASVEAARRYGTGAGAARLITGNHPLYEGLETRLAQLKRTQDAVVFGSGYLANIGTIPALVGRPDLICIDELAHSCLLSGAALAGSTVLRFRHNDPSHVSDLLGAERGQHRHCLILTEGVFSMDGDLAPLPELTELAAQHDAWLLTDDAHALGVIGDGRGSSFAFEPACSVGLQMGTLSKAAGSYGGYVCASREVCDLLRNRARSFVYSTGLPPGVVAASSKALDIIATQRDLVAQPLARARQFTEALGLPAAESAIVPLIVGDSQTALDISARLAGLGFLVPAIRPPTVPVGTARLRLAFSTAHSAADVEGLARAIDNLALLH
jgi:8-amino-7-oxononanoate synthase